MPTFKLPLSGDVVQTISPWTAFMSPIGSQLRLSNVAIGQSSEPAVEADVLTDVASYGKQLGRIADALVVLLAHFHPAAPLTKEETAAIDDLKEMLQRIADVKDKHKRKAMRPYVAELPDQAPAPSPSMPASTAMSAAAVRPPSSRSTASKRSRSTPSA